MVQLRRVRDGMVRRTDARTSTDEILRIGELRRSMREVLDDVLRWDVSEVAQRALREVSEVGQ